MERLVVEGHALCYNHSLPSTYIRLRCRCIYLHKILIAQLTGVQVAVCMLLQCVQAVFVVYEDGSWLFARQATDSRRSQRHIWISLHWFRHCWYGQTSSENLHFCYARYLCGNMLSRGLSLSGIWACTYRLVRPSHLMLTKRSFYSTCNSILGHSNNVDELVQLRLQELYSLPILTYIIAALDFKAKQLAELYVCWNSVYRHLFRFHKWESVGDV